MAENSKTVIVDEIFEKEWREYLSAVEGLDVTCKRIAELFFNAGRIHEIKDKVEGIRRILI